MTEFDSHITSLLRHHDCVVMAGIGAFVAVSEPATFSADGLVATPPRREIRFNSAITADDGLLNWSLSRKLSIPYEQAAALAGRMLSDAAERLRIEGTLTFNRIGSLRRGHDGRITFLPAPESLLTISLPEIKLKKLKSAPLISLEIEHKTPERSVAIVKVPLRRRLIGAAACVIILLGLGFVLTTPIDVTTAHEASLALPEFTQPATVEALPAPADLSLQMAIPSDETIMQVKPKPQAADEIQPARYVLVVASLPTRQQAEKFIVNSADNRLQILEKDGKFRVYVTAGATQDEVAANARAIEGLSAAYPDAWVCRK